MGRHTRKPRAVSTRGARCAACLGAITWLTLIGCGTRFRTVTLEALESGQLAPLRPAARLVADGRALRDLCTPIGPRLGLFQVHTPGQWERLAQAIPQLGRCPDLHKGSVIGLACWAGTPIDGRFPLQIESVRVAAGGGLLSATFRGGSYLPDGTAWVETGYVEGLRAVLMVSVNGTAFFPEAGDANPDN